MDTNMINTKRYIQILPLLVLLLQGCASNAFLDARAAHGIESMSDWVFERDRRWIPDETQLQTRLIGGLNFDNGTTLYVESTITGPWQQTLIGFTKSFGSPNDDGKWHFVFEPALVHQVDSLTEEFLRTDQKQWQGHNPFIHVRVGLRRGRFKCPMIASGKSLFQGAPFESEDNAPDLYWLNVECTVRLFGDYQ